jgi:hypothetical protein
MENKEFFSLFPDFRFDEKIEKPLELISHSNVISTNALNTVTANAIEKCNALPLAKGRTPMLMCHSLD